MEGFGLDYSEPFPGGHSEVIHYETVFSGKQQYVCIFGERQFIVNSFSKRNKKALMLGIQATNRHMMGQNDVRFCRRNYLQHRTGILLNKVEHAQDLTKSTWETLHLTNEETINTDQSILLVQSAGKPKIFLLSWINFRGSGQDPHQTYFNIQ